MKIFGFQDACKKRIFVGSKVPCSMGNKALINSIKVSDGQTTIINGLADIIPGAKGNGVRRVIILDTCPPKSTDDGIDLLNKSF